MASRSARVRKAVVYREEDDEDKDVISDEEAGQDEGPASDDEDKGFARKKKTPKKAAASSGGGKAAARPAGGAKKLGAAAAPSSTISGAVKANKNLTPVVGAFLQRYNDESTRVRARIELVNFLFVSAGAPGDVVDFATEEPDLDGPEAALDMDKYVGYLSAVLDDVAPDSLGDVDAEGGGPDYYPLHPSPGGKASRRAANGQYRAGFVAFWGALVRESTLDTLVGAPGLLDSVVGDILTPCASAPLRPLRHAGTLAAMAVGHALLVKAGEARGSLGSMERQARADGSVVATLQRKLAEMEAAAAAADGKAKGGRKFAAGGGVSPDLAATREALRSVTARAEALSGQVATLSESIDALTSGAVSAVMEGVFVHRYRDVDGHVRRDALDVYGRWLLDAPEALLANSYLKYAGWMLNDQASPAVRTSALAALAPLYSLSPALVERLGDFTARFRGRVAAMLEDVSPGVCIGAARTLHAMLLADQLTVDEVRAVRRQVTSPSLAMRRAAGAFLLDQLPAFGPAPASGDGEEQDEGGEVDMGGDAAPAGKGATAKTKAAAARKAAREAAAAAASSRRSRTQLLSLLVVACELGENEGDVVETGGGDDAEDGRVAHSRTAEYVASAFWGHAQAGVLSSWGTYLELLSGTSSSGPGGAAGDEEEGAGELTPSQQAMLLRLLAACAMRASGRCKLDGEPGVPVSAGASSSGKKAGAAAATDDEGGSDADAAPGFHLSSSPEDVAKARSALSDALAPALPELLSKFGPHPHSLALLSAVIQRLSLSAFGSHRLGKAYGDTLYHLSRLVSSVHASPLGLAAAVAALRYFASESHAKARDAEAAVAKLVTSLAARAVSLIATVTGDAPAPDAGAAPKRGKSGSRGSKRAVGRAASAATMQVDGEDEDGEEEEEGAGGAASSVAVASVTLVAVLRRLSSVCKALDVAALGCASDVSPGSALVASLIRLLRHGRRINALFQAAASHDGGSEDGGLHYELVSLPLDALCSLLTHTLQRAGALAEGVVDPAGASDAERSAVERLAGDAASYRDAALPHILSFLRLRHPAVVAEAIKAAAADGASVDSAPPGGDADSTMGGGDGFSEAAAIAHASPETYSLPLGCPPPQARYIWHARLAGFRALVTLAHACAPAALRDTLLAEAAWSPAGSGAALAAAGGDPDALTSAVHMFVNAALSSPPGELGWLGIAVPDVPLTLVGANGTGGEDVEEEDETMLAPAAREAQSAARKASLQRARAQHLLAPLAHLAILCSGSPKLTNLLAGRQMEDSNEAGAPGVEVVRAGLRELKRRSPEDLLTLQLGALEEAGAILRVTGAQADAAMQAGDADAHAAAVGTLDSIVAQVSALARRQAKEVHPVGRLKASDSVWVKATVRMLQRGITTAVGDAPESLPLFGFLGPYLGLVPTEMFAFLLRFTDSRIREVVGRDDALPLMNAANKWWAARSLVRSDSEVLMGTQSAEFGGYTLDQLRPWAPCIAFRRCLEAGLRTGKTQDVASTVYRALRVSLGLVDSGAAGAGGAPASAAASTARRAQRGRAARRDAEEEEEDDEEEEAEGDEAATQGTAVRRRLLAAGGEGAAARSVAGSKARGGGGSRSGSSRSRGAAKGGRGRSAMGDDGEGEEEEDSQLMGDGSDEVSLVRRPSGMGIPLSITQSSSSASQGSGTKGGKGAKAGAQPVRSGSSMGISLTGASSASAGGRKAAPAAAAAGSPGRSARPRAAAARKSYVEEERDEDEEEEEEDDDDDDLGDEEEGSLPVRTASIKFTAGSGSRRAAVPAPSVSPSQTQSQTQRRRPALDDE